MAYDPAMKQGELVIGGRAAMQAQPDKFVETPERLPLASGTITTNLLTQTPFGVSFAEHGYNNQEELIPTNISFYFEQGRSKLRRSELGSDRGEEFDAFIASKNVTRTVTITGTHSPEGPERINSELAEERAEAIEAWYRAQMDKYDYENMADEIEFIIKPVVEDWSLFSEMLDAYDGLTAEQKGEVKMIINAGTDFETKEDRLQTLDFYDEIFDNIYPELRRAKSDILTVKPKKTDAEISILAKQIADGSVDADTLSIEELMYAATLTPSMEEKAAIYQAAVTKANTWQAHNNLGAALLSLASKSGDDAQVEKAITHLESARNMASGEAMVLSNLGQGYFMQGNLEGAYETMNDATDLNPGVEAMRNVNAVRGVLEINMGRYNQAVSTFANVNADAANYTNKGLALILNKEYMNAISALDDAIGEDDEYAMAYYLKAVASARLGNAGDVITNLTRAISHDPELKEMAVIDLEFVNLAGNSEFQAVLD